MSKVPFTFAVPRLVARVRVLRDRREPRRLRQRSLLRLRNHGAVRRYRRIWPKLSSHHRNCCRGPERKAYEDIEQRKC